MSWDPPPPRVTLQLKTTHRQERKEKQSTLFPRGNKETESVVHDCILLVLSYTTHTPARKKDTSTKKQKVYKHTNIQHATWVSHRSKFRLRVDFTLLRDGCSSCSPSKLKPFSAKTSRGGRDFYDHQHNFIKRAKKNKNINIQRRTHMSIINIFTRKRQNLTHVIFVVTSSVCTISIRMSRKAAAAFCILNKGSSCGDALPLGDRTPATTVASTKPSSMSARGTCHTVTYAHARTYAHTRARSTRKIKQPTSGRRHTHDERANLRIKNFAKTNNNSQHYRWRFNVDLNSYHVEFCRH